MAKFSIIVTENFSDNFQKLSKKEQALVERKVELLSESKTFTILDKNFVN